MKFWGMKRVAVDLGLVYKMMLQKASTMEILYSIAQELFENGTGSSPTRDLNMEIILDELIENGYLEINLNHIGELIGKFNYYPKWEVIQAAINNKEQLGRSEYHSVLLQSPKICSHVISDLDKNPDKYELVESKHFYNGLSVIKDTKNNYNWNTLLTILVSRRPNIKGVDKILGRNALISYVNKVNQLIEGVEDNDIRSYIHIPALDQDEELVDYLNVTKSEYEEERIPKHIQVKVHTTSVVDDSVE